jgi:hypothetical protein
VRLRLGKGAHIDKARTAWMHRLAGIPKNAVRGRSREPSDVHRGQCPQFTRNGKIPRHMAQTDRSADEQNVFGTHEHSSGSLTDCEFSGRKPRCVGCCPVK